MPAADRLKRPPNATGWSQPLAFPITLRDGHVIETMAQAAGLMTQRLPKKRQLTPIWQKTAEMLMAAHASGKRLDIGHATAQLRRALGWEGWGA